MTEADRLELARWSTGFARDTLAGRVAALAPIIEQEVARLERAIEDAREGLGATPSPAPVPATRAEPSPTPVAQVAPRAATSTTPETGDALLSGLIQEGLLSDVLQMLSANLKTGLFQIVGPQVAASIWFEAGEVRHAVAGSLSGEEAFFAALASGSGTFFFTELSEIPPERTITGKTQFLILEGLRKMDEEGQPPEGGG